MTMKKFQPHHQQSITGFWIPELNAPLVGVLVEHVRGVGDKKPFFVVSVEEETVNIRSRDMPSQRANKGERIGVSSFSQLRGLEQHVGHRISIRYLGETIVRTGRPMKKFDVDLSSEPVESSGRPLASESSASGGVDDDDDIPF